MRFSTLTAFGGALLVATSSASACSSTFPVALETSTEAPRLDARPTNPTCLAGPLPLGRVRLAPTYSGLVNPLRMIDQPERGLVYVVEMAGRIKAIERATGKVTTALDYVAKARKDGSGFLGAAVHPTKPFIYVTAERDPDSTSLKDFPVRDEIIRFTIDASGAIDITSESRVIRLDRRGELHSAGTLEFGKDGFLYIGVGESAADPANRATDLLTGSILRLDVDSAEPYAVPPHNPFVNGGGRAEVYASGFRNPWRFTFDRATGDLWEGDVGANSYEEINRVEPGKNYGWPSIEGMSCSPPKTECDRTGFTAPVFAYAHSEGGSITGGYVYRGKAMPDLVGKYIYADFTTGHVRMLDGTGAAAKAVFLNPGGPKPAVSSFGEDADGELYAIGWDDGIIYKLVPGEASTEPIFPPKLSQTGCVDPTNPTQPVSGLIPYDVNMELWSEGTDKRRFVAIPDGKTVHVEDDGHFSLPENSVAVKEFSVGGRRIETRLLRHHPGGQWSAATYEWNDAQTEAVLSEAAKDKTLPNGQTYALPSSIQCFICHKAVAGRTLGFESLQLNRQFAYAPGQSQNQIKTLSDIGYLDKKLDGAALPSLPTLQGGGPVEDRARAYLHANCSNCHRLNGGTGAPLDFRFDQPRASFGVCVPSPAGFPGVSGVKIVNPGDPARSSIFLRMSTTTDYLMPPLVRRKVDDVAVSLMTDWIRSLTPCP